MKTFHLLALLFVATLMIANVPADEPQSDEDRLQGTWALQRGEAGGVSLAEVLKEKGIQDLQIDFAGDAMTMRGLATRDFKYRFKLLPDENPKGIDSILAEAHGTTPKGTRVPGIYKIEGDTLTLCVANNPTDERPKKFESPAGATLSLLVLTRVKP